MLLLTAGGVPLVGPLAIKELHDVVTWTHSWDLVDAVTYDDNGTERVDHIPDRSSHTHPLIRDQGFYGPAYGQPICDGPLYIASSARFRNYPAMVGQSGTQGGLPMLASTRNPADYTTWFGGTSGIAQPYWCAVCVRSLEGNPGSGVWDAMQGSIGTTVSIFTNLAGDNWGATTGVRPGIDVWPDTGVPQNENSTLLLIVNVNGTSSFWEFNVVSETGAFSTIRFNSFDLAADPAREIFLGWVGHSCYFSFGAIKAGEFAEADFTAVRSFALSRLANRATSPLPAEP